MDNRLCESQEHGRDSSDCDRDIPEIAYRKIDWIADCARIAPVFIAFHANVNQESIEEWKEIHGIPFHKVELLCAQYAAERAEGYMVEVDGLVVGYILGHHFADAVLFVRHIFVYPEWEGLKLGKGLVGAFGKPIARVIFQTRKENEPNKLLEHIAKKAQKIAESKLMNTWEMEWNNG